MQPPALTPDEEHRLKILHPLGILDTEPEERFDRLTRMAKRIFRVPIALVSLVDANRQWFKSCDGLEASETPRDISFCGHAILGDEIFLIPDARADERFADNPLVTGAPNIRFYAGCPLRSARGAKVGTLCIISDQARDFDADDAAALKDLAAMVEDELTAFQEATTDELTRISNRRGFVSLAQYSLNFCARHNAPASLVFFDLDNFKPINDRFGHAEGDRALIAFASAMRASFRKTDVFARLGGDEFVALISSAGQSDAQTAVSHLAEQIERDGAAAHRPYNLEFSCGIVEYDPQIHPSIDGLLADGDALMYRLKAAKKTLGPNKTL